MRVVGTSVSPFLLESEHVLITVDGVWLQEPLREYCFMTVFRLVDISLLFFTAQQPMIFENILLRFEWIPCGPLLSAESNAKCQFFLNHGEEQSGIDNMWCLVAVVCSFVLICQMFLLSLASSFLLAPHRCALFDVFPSRKAALSQVRDCHLPEGRSSWLVGDGRDNRQGRKSRVVGTESWNVCKGPN